MDLTVPMESCIRETLRVTLRFRLAFVAGFLTWTVSGCNEFQPQAPLPYASDKATSAKLADKPKVQARVSQLVSQLFGPNTEELRVPPGAPLPEAGARIASQVLLAEGDSTKPGPVIHEAGKPDTPIRGGLGLYREHCMHCHGASGDGNGPTALFLWPRPRDFRTGVYKFTSTEGTGVDSKPTRQDLKRTLLDGIDNSSMSSFAAVLTPSEIDQVLDYIVFLSLRGEVETTLATLGQDVSEDDAETDLSEDVAQEAIDLVFGRWTNAAERVIAPPSARPEATPESIERGKQLYLGAKGLQCFGCHGLDGKGNGESFVDYRSFVRAVFQGNPSQDKIDELKDFAEKNSKKWADDWGQPLRPANLQAGRFKGGRRPIDLYWRVAKGINGTPMPAHFSSSGGSLLTSDEVWDVVNFVLALPSEKSLLEGAKAVELAPSTATANHLPSAGSPDPSQQPAS